MRHLHIMAYFFLLRPLSVNHEFETNWAFAIFTFYNEYYFMCTILKFLNGVTFYL